MADIGYETEKMPGETETQWRRRIGGYKPLPKLDFSSTVGQMTPQIRKQLIDVANKKMMERNKAQYGMPQDAPPPPEPGIPAEPQAGLPFTGPMGPSQPVGQRPISPVADPEIAAANDEESKRMALAQARADIMKRKNDLHEANFAAREEGILNQARGTAARNTQQRQLLPPDQALAGKVGGIDDASIRRRALGDYNRFGNGGVILKQPPVAAQEDPNALTPADIARQAAMSRMKFRGKETRGGGMAGAAEVNLPEDAGLAMAIEEKMKQNRKTKLASDTNPASADLRAANTAEREKRNALRAFQRGALTQGAYKVAQSKGYLPQPAQANGSAVGHLESIYGQGNVPPDAYNEAMKQDAETHRAELHYKQGPDKAALAEMMKAKMLAEMMGTLHPGGVPIGPDGKPQYHPLVQDAIDSMMRSRGAQPPPPPELTPDQKATESMSKVNKSVKKRIIEGMLYPVEKGMEFGNKWMYGNGE